MKIERAKECYENIAKATLKHLGIEIETAESGRIVEGSRNVLKTLQKVDETDDIIVAEFEGVTVFNVLPAMYQNEKTFEEAREDVIYNHYHKEEVKGALNKALLEYAELKEFIDGLVEQGELYKEGVHNGEFFDIEGEDCLFLSYKTRQ